MINKYKIEREIMNIMIVSKYFSTNNTIEK